MENNQQTIIVKTQKSAGTAALLAFFFGPLGMLFSTGMGALIMFFVTGIVAFFTVGFGLLLTNPICAIWAYMKVKKDNAETSIIATNSVSQKPSVTKTEANTTVKEDGLFD